MSGDRLPTRDIAIYREDAAEVVHARSGSVVYKRTWIVYNWTWRKRWTSYVTDKNGDVVFQPHRHHWVDRRARWWWAGGECLSTKEVDALLLLLLSETHQRCWCDDIYMWHYVGVLFVALLFLVSCKIYTVSHKKTCRIIFDCKSGISWAIFTAHSLYQW